MDKLLGYVALLGSPSFWLLTTVICFACLIPDFTIDAWEQMVPEDAFTWSKIKKVQLNSISHYMQEVTLSLFVLQLLKRGEDKGAQIFDNTARRLSNFSNAKYKNTYL
jgi:hypothetical protein